MMLGAGMIHMSHEYSAWNLALGICFLAGVAWTGHLAGTLPVLASFIAVLSTLSAIDLLHGTVEITRVISHILIVAGTALVAVIVALDSPGPRRWIPTALHRRRPVHPAEPRRDRRGRSARRTRSLV